MEPNQKPKTSAKDFFLNLGSIISLGTVAGYLISLLFTVIDKAYPPVTNYGYYGSYSISWPVATLIIFFPIYLLLMWFLEKGYVVEPERRGVGVRKWLTYVTLFLAGLATAGDLVTVLYYFIDGQDITTGFIMKVLSVLVVALGVFFYYISDVLGKLNGISRKVWTGVATFIILASVVWGFSVLGSPRAQQQLKYDEQRVSDLRTIDQNIFAFWNTKKVLPLSLEDLSKLGYYGVLPLDPQSQKSYEYRKINETSYELCVDFKQPSDPAKKAYVSTPYPAVAADSSWSHPAGRFCFPHTIDPNNYSGGKLPM